MKYNNYLKKHNKKMTLGSVQFGLSYGITNSDGQVSEKDSVEIIRCAINKGVKCIDTAAVYGNSEKVIGKALLEGWSRRVNIITKILPTGLSKGKNSSNQSLAFEVRNSVINSRANLRDAKIHTLMLHRANHLNNKYVLDELISLKKDGVIKKIGVSVQNADELQNSLLNENISIIQMPFNVLDYRWDSIITKLVSVKKQRDIVVHARSALLQGLLCTPDVNKWKSAGVYNGEQISDWLYKKQKEYKKSSVADLCIGYVNSQEWIDSVVIGVDSKEHLVSNLNSISQPLLDVDIMDDLKRSRPLINERSLDPSNWEKI